MTRYETPPVPDSIKAIRHPLYRNIYEYDLGNKNLWGTESLLGDWSGTYLLIAKDFYPSSYIEKAKDSEPYRHKHAAPTNRNLLKTLRHFGRYTDGVSHTDCGFLYVSACFLLRADGKVRGKLPDEAKVLDLSWPVLQFTIDNMPNLRHVVLMGKQAQLAMERSPLIALITRHGGQTYHVSHPANAMTDQDRFAEWGPVIGTTR